MNSLLIKIYRSKVHKYFHGARCCPVGLNSYVIMVGDDCISHVGLSSPERAWKSAHDICVANYE